MRVVIRLNIAMTGNNPPKPCEREGRTGEEIDGVHGVPVHHH